MAVTECCVCPERGGGRGVSQRGQRYRYSRRLRGLSCCYLAKDQDRCLLSSVWRTIARCRSHANKGQRGGAQRFVVPRAGGCEYQVKGLPGEGCRSQSGDAQLHAGRGWMRGKSLSIGTASWVLRYLVMVPWRPERIMTAWGSRR